MPQCPCFYALVARLMRTGCYALHERQRVSRMRACHGANPSCSPPNINLCRTYKPSVSAGPSRKTRMSMHPNQWQQDIPGSSKTSSEGACACTNRPFFPSEAGIPEPRAPLGFPGSLWRSGYYSFSASRRPCIRISKTATKVCAFGVHHNLFPLSDLFTVFNYWEPLHYLYKAYGFQTWETSPQYAIRSWAYSLLWFLPSKIPFWILHETGKVSSPTQVRSYWFLFLHCRDQPFSSCELSWPRYAPSLKQNYTTPYGSRLTIVSPATCYSC
jgi:hypothetical protein